MHASEPARLHAQEISKRHKKQLPAPCPAHGLLRNGRRTCAMRGMVAASKEPCRPQILVWSPVVGGSDFERYSLGTRALVPLTFDRFGTITRSCTKQISNFFSRASAAGLFPFGQTRCRTPSSGTRKASRPCLKCLCEVECERVDFANV